MQRSLGPALLGGFLITLTLSACAPAPPVTKTHLAKRPAPTPAEQTALRHYKMGIDAYANDQYAEAISHWKVTLANDPTNLNAADYIARAQNMLKAVKSAPKQKAK